MPSWKLIVALVAAGVILLVPFVGEGLQKWSVPAPWEEALKILGAFYGVFLGAYLAAWLEARREEQRRQRTARELKEILAADFEYNANQLNKASEREKKSTEKSTGVKHYGYGDLGLRLEEIERIMHMDSFFLIDRGLRDRIRDAYRQCLDAQHLESGVVAATSYRSLGDEAYREPFVVLNPWARYGIDSWKFWRDRRQKEQPEWSEDDVWQEWLEEQHHSFYRELAAKLERLAKDLRSAT